VVEPKAGPRLEPLSCRTCGAAVAVGPGALATCSHCGAQVEIPAAYRELRDDWAHANGADASAQALYRRLVRRPAWLLRVLSAWFNPASLVLGAFAAMFIVALLCEVAVAWVASTLGSANYFDTWLAALSTWDAVVLGLAFAYVGTILAAFGQRRSVSRCGLQQALAAPRPTIMGGAAACRCCGAPLFAEDGQIGVRCMYCGADNLLAVPQPWIERLSERTLGLIRETASARDALAAEDARVRKSVAWYVVAASVLAVLFLLGFRQTIVERPAELSDWPPSYALYRKSAAPMLVEHRLVEKDTLYYSDHRQFPARTSCTSGEPAVESTITPALCDYGACEARYYVALARGDTLTVVAASIPSGASIRVQQHGGMDWNDDDRSSQGTSFGPELLRADLPSGAAFDVQPRIDAWHRITVSIPVPTEPEVIALCIALVRRPEG
jgi:hypothetical protein